jgi:hypothetical protein
MRKLLITLTLASVVISLTSSAAHAGGALLDFDGPAIVGTTVSGSVLVGDGQQAPVSAGPWFAELQASEGSDLDPIPLGPVDIRPSNIYGWRVTVTFTVPDVPIGEYWVVVHNQAGHGMGDLTGGVVTIAHTPTEAALWTAVSRARHQAATRLERLEGLRERNGQMEYLARDHQATIDRQAERLTAAGARISSLEADLVATAPSTPPWPLWTAGPLALALGFGGFAVGRRYATRTLVTGASRSWAENQDAPASAEPNTSPLVAPK